MSSSRRQLPVNGVMAASRAGGERLPRLSVRVYCLHGQAAASASMAFRACIQVLDHDAHNLVLFDLPWNTQPIVRQRYDSIDAALTKCHWDRVPCVGRPSFNEREIRPASSQNVVSRSWCECLPKAHRTPQAKN